jgi:endonuclease/exonuclease/phosphatase family metal-dependent hydrolase
MPWRWTVRPWLCGLAAAGCTWFEADRVDRSGEPWPHPPGSSTAQRAGLRLATFNVSNLFNDRVEQVAGGRGPELTLSSVEYPRKISGVARIVDELGAAVVVLQEVENRAVLADLAGLTATDYPFRLLIEGNDPRGIDVAVLSVHPPLELHSHRHDLFPLHADPGERWYRYARDCLELHLELGGVRVIVLAVHFKSKRDDDPQLRLAEAQHTRLIADSLAARYPGSGIVIAGDFNDVPGSRAVTAVEGQHPAYLSAAQQLPVAERWTVAAYAADGGVALHDDLWLSPSLARGLQRRSVTVIHDLWLPADLAAVSDHAPLAATFLVAGR